MANPHISDSHRPALEAIATEMDCQWGGKPSLGKLLAKVAEGDLVITKAWEPDLMMVVIAKFHSTIAKFHSLSAEEYPFVLFLGELICAQPNVREGQKHIVEAEMLHLKTRWDAKKNG